MPDEIDQEMLNAALVTIEELHRAQDELQVAMRQMQAKLSQAMARTLNLEHALTRLCPAHPLLQLDG